MKQETIRLYDEGNYDLLPLVINRLSHVLLWEHASVSLRIRRGIAKYRLRDLKDALRDLDEAAELSTRGVNGVGGQHAPDVDALRARALVKDEMQYAPPCSSFAFFLLSWLMISNSRQRFAWSKARYRNRPRRKS